MKSKKKLKENLEDIKLYQQYYNQRLKEQKIKAGNWLSQEEYDNLIRRFKNHEELTIKERKILGIGDIKINRVQCLLCKDIITSNFRHDYKKCKCGNAMVDGGSWYIRRSVDNTKDLSEEYKEKE